MGREDYRREGLPAIPDAPQPWSGGPEHVLWFDPHISQQVLFAHAEDSFDASRPRRIRRRTVGVIRRTLRAAGFPPERSGTSPPLVLDLACGPGYHAEALAEAGYRVIGVDGNGAAIRQARSRTERNTGIAAGRLLFLEMVVDREFPAGISTLLQRHSPATAARPAAALMLYGTWLTLAPWVRGAVLDGLSQVLAPGAVFMLDLYSNSYLRRLRNSGDPLLSGGGQRWQEFPTGGFWTKGPHLLIRQNLDYGPGGPFLQRYLVAPRTGQPGAPGSGVGDIREFRIWHDLPDLRALRALGSHYGFRVSSRRMLRGAARGLLDWRWIVMRKEGAP